MTQLVWFRSDLRVGDNTALVSACVLAKANHTSVHAVFVASPAQWHEHNVGLPKRDFLARNLQALSEELASIGIALTVLVAPHFREATKVLLEFAKQQNAAQVHWQTEFGFDERTRDAAVTKALTNVGIVASAYQDRCLVDPAKVLTQSGTPYKVFSAFKRNWLSILIDTYTAPKPASNKAELNFKPLPKKELELSCFYLPSESAHLVAQIAEFWPAGETEARRRLELFMDESVRGYKTDRDFPAINGTSTLSPYLSAGVIGPRQCLVAWLNSAQGDWHEPRLQAWLNELAWRDFYHYVMWHFPKVSKNMPFQDKTRAVVWRHAPAEFKAWCEGKTGVPLVDAAMLQLNNTGWMHNRLRMVVASYLTKNLFIDWRLGEAYFMQKLVDADFCANNGGWQWSASTGTDAAPYFRVFNPVSQSQRFDPEGAFIKRWLPELSHLSAKQIHAPPLSAKGSYPAPLVDLKVTRRAAIEAFAVL